MLQGSVFMFALEMKGVSKKYSTNKKYSTVALDNVSLTLRENEFVGIMGTSGSGKTTLLNVASGIDKCDGGEISIGEINISAMGKNELSQFRRGHIGIVFQDYNLINSLTIRENIMIPLILDQKLEMIQDDPVPRLGDMLEISDIMERYPYEVSGGQQQRAAICRAIINNPKILFADEPTGNLDGKSSEKVLSYFSLIHRSYKTSILMVTHDPFTACHCDRVVFLEDGCIAQEITKESANTKDFFGVILNTIPSIQGTSKQLSTLRHLKTQIP
jgi:putative ABC transport system ATP-binding protein